MNKYLSKKITYLSFYAIIGVVYCHAYNYYNRFLQPTTILAEGMTPGAMLQFFISNGLVRFGVPLFFCFSGYLFFCNWDFKWKEYLQKIGKRIRTLVIPYLIWTILAGGLLYSVYRVVGVERYSIVKEKVGALLEYDPLTWLLSSPAFQLWYVLDLLKLVIISPVIYWLLKKCKLLPVIIFGVFWVFELTFFINCEGLLFFTLGSYLAINKVKILGMEELQDNTKNMKGYKINTYLLTILWIGGCFIYALISATMGNFLYTPYILLLLYKVNVITGLCAVWKQYDLKAGQWQEKKWVKAMVSCTVFVYMAHEPLLHLLTDILLEKFMYNGVHTLVYFGLPLLIIAGCIGLGLGIKKVCPKVYGVLVGGRGTER